MALGKRLTEAASDHTRKAKKHRHREWLHLVDVDEFLETLEVGNISKATADERLFSCPFPGHSAGDSRPSAYMNDGSKDKSKATVWKCHGCGRSGNAITFYAEIENVSKQQAANDLRERYAPNFRKPRGGSISAEFELWLRDREKKAAQAPVKAPTIPQKRYDKLFAVDWEDAWSIYEEGDAPAEIAYMFDRGFTVETLVAWDIGYDERTQRITIPVHNADGEIVGVKGRSWKSKRAEKIKYLILGDNPAKPKRFKYGFPYYEKSLIVFGLHKLEGPVETLVLVEGELDVLALWQIGIPAVCTGSAHLSETQAKLVRDWCDEVIVFFDTNTAGEQGTFGWYDKDDEFHPGVLQALQPFIRVKIVDDHEGDASELVQDNREDELRELFSSAKSALHFILE